MIGLQDFKKILFEEKEISLENLASMALIETQKRFGKTIELYAPLYISNHCSSVCSYCNYSAHNKKIYREHLHPEQAEKEMLRMKESGLDDILLLTGEMEDENRGDFVAGYVDLAKKYFTRVGVEIFPCNYSEYRQLHAAGVDYVTVYQETYDREIYRKVHKAGQKRDYDYRRETPGRVLESGIRGIGMGILLGLSEPKKDLLALAEHLIELRKIYWDHEFAVSFPRINDRSVKYPVSEIFLAKVIFLFRLLFPDASLLLSTRENRDFRNGMAGLGINKMSAGSKTTVGGYVDNLNVSSGEGQFDIEDMRSVAEVIQAIKSKGLSPVLKNHAKIYQ